MAWRCNGHWGVSLADVIGSQVVVRGFTAIFRVSLAISLLASSGPWLLFLGSDVRRPLLRLYPLLPRTLTASLLQAQSSRRPVIGEQEHEGLCFHI